MDYALENLDPERFQHFCQALLAIAFPRIQCFPVAQRDGGRDALSYYPDSDNDEFIVFQVKYVRRPQAESDPHRWLRDVLELEAPKLRALIPKGAKEYYLLTNVAGTAHPDSGSIDSVQSILSANIDIPSQCWWRDDINRRIDNAWNLKWSYPELLNGQDLLRVIIEAGLDEDSQRRTSAIRAFVRDQFEREREVKFKQVELQNKLLDLFVDVPIKVNEASVFRKYRPIDVHVLNAVSRDSGVNPHASEDATLGAATLLLHPVAQDHFVNVVLEGAPGQGKSTIAQYLCQIHRGKILNDSINDERIPEAHRNAPIRLPFKIDCRDLSHRLARRDPFSADDAALVPLDWQKTVESFLAHQIMHFSGGSTFTVADVHAVMRISAVLLLFDGLDEVAEINRRREVVDEISKSVSRLREVALSVQAIVTSRPAAFANSPGMPEDKFQYFELVSITRRIIDEYAEKWLRARRLEGKEASDVRRILKEKVDQPHLRELARNPMQLAILLSLIQTRGGSLPDKRTALYDNYVELFFNRESEKSPIVRDHRDLLVDIHRYLAWVLHSEAQTRETRGSVSAERLRELVERYLNDEGHDTSLAQKLFTGMVERVVALVSRVQGAYEFEVQPLREYFAARHLYNTAPYSPPGQERKGTLPDRFDALSRDFFWQNVTRFYSGCYNKGELPSLVDRLEDLARSPGYKETSHPQGLAATLLSDWVFAQHPKSMRQVVALIVNGIGMRQIASAGIRHRRDEPLVLPRQSGCEELVERCFELLQSMPPFDFAVGLIELLRANATARERHDKWLNALPSLSSSNVTQWIRYAYFMGTLSLLSDEQLEALVADGRDVPERLLLILRSGRAAFIDSSQERFRRVVEYLVERHSEWIPRRPDGLLESFQQSLSPANYACAFRDRQPQPLRNVWELYYGQHETAMRVDFTGTLVFGDAELCKRFVSLAIDLSKRDAFEWATRLEPWDALIEGGRRLFGDKWSFFDLANTAAGIKSKSEVCDDATDFFDSSVSLARRVRYARLRAGTANWWGSVLERAKEEEEDSTVALLVLLTWCGQSVFERLAPVIDDQLARLSPQSWTRLNESLQSVGLRFGTEKREIDLALRNLPVTLSPRTVVALFPRVSDDAAIDMYRTYVAKYDGDDLNILRFSQRIAIVAAQKTPQSWMEWLSVIAKTYSKGAVFDEYAGYRFARALHRQLLPLKVAQEIVTQCYNYPSQLVGLAEQVCRKQVAEDVVPVGAIAERDGWF